MARSRTISVRVIKPGPSGVAVLHGDKWELCIDADQVRRLYYAVLGLKIGDDRPLEQIVSSSKGKIDIDFPEDILRVEHVLKGKKK